MPRLPSGEGLKWTNLFMIVIFAVIGLYLFSQFSTTGADGREFSVPTDIDKTILMIFRILIVGSVVLGSYAIYMKINKGTLTQKDAFTLILIGIGIIWLWAAILQPVLQAPSLDNISFSVGQKLGFFKP